MAHSNWLFQFKQTVQFDSTGIVWVIFTKSFEKKFFEFLCEFILFGEVCREPSPRAHRPQPLLLWSDGRPVVGSIASNGYRGQSPGSPSSSWKSSGAFRFTVSGFPWRRRRSCTDRPRPRRPTAGLEPTQFHPHAGRSGALSWVTQRYDSDPSEPGPRGSCTLVVKSCPYEMRSDRNMFGWTSGQLTDVFYLRKQ